MNTSEWAVQPEGLAREFVCKNFSDAVTFVSALAPVANARNHHPDVLIHGYKRVRCMLKTHDVGMITEKDYQLAREIDALWADIKQSRVE